jgi:hypothetical protein
MGQPEVVVMRLELKKYTLIEYPRVDLRPESRARALFLINGHYSDLYGKQIRYESVRSMRVKIIELEAHMDTVRISMPCVYKALARQCTDFERICALLEILA